MKKLAGDIFTTIAILGLLAAALIALVSGLFWAVACYAVVDQLLSADAPNSSTSHVILTAFFFFHLMAVFGGGIIYALTRKP